MFKFLEVSNRRRSILVYTVVAVVIVGGLTLLYFVSKDWYIWFAAEDSVAESLTALFYLAAGVVLIVHSLNKIRREQKVKLEILSLLLGLFFVFIAAEEISWGQRFFHIPEPGFLKGRTFDDDLSVHNLLLFGNPLFEGSRLLNLFIIVTGILLPVFYSASGRVRKLLNDVNFQVVPLACLPIFFLGLVYGLGMVRVFRHWSPTEIKEFIFSIGFLLFSLSAATGKNKLPSREAA